MPEPLLAKLMNHINRTGRYPPLIVRPSTDEPGPDDTPCYQILDGHHRAEALRRLAYLEATCVVWEVDDEQSLLLLATLNRLQGQDDPHKRASLCARLSQQYPAEHLAELLPESTDQVRKLLELSAPAPPPRRPLALNDMPVAVHFFLLPEQKRQLDNYLEKLGGPREEALMRLVLAGD